MTSSIRTDRRVYSVLARHAPPELLEAGTVDSGWIELAEAPTVPTFTVVWSRLSPSRFAELSILADQRARKVVLADGGDPEEVVRTELERPVTAREEVKRAVLSSLAARHGAVECLHVPDTLPAGPAAAVVASLPVADLLALGNRVLSASLEWDPFAAAASTR